MRLVMGDYFQEGLEKNDLVQKGHFSGSSCGKRLVVCSVGKSWEKRKSSKRPSVKPYVFASEMVVGKIFTRAAFSKKKSIIG